MILDLIVIGILLVSALVAFWRGFVREVLTIFSLIGAAGATYMFGPDVAQTTKGWLVDADAPEKQRLFDLIPYDVIGMGIGFVLVFMGVLLAFTFIAHWFSRGLHAVGLGPVDRSLGVVFGLVRGVVLVALMSVVLHFIVSEGKREDYFADSKTYPYIAYMADLGEAMMPGKDAVSKDAIKQRLRGIDVLEPGQKNPAAEAASGKDVAPVKDGAKANKTAPAAGGQSVTDNSAGGRMND